MTNLIKKIVLTVFIVGSLSACVYTICNTMGLFDSKPEPRQHRPAAKPAVPPPLPQTVIENLRKSGVSEERIQKMIAERNSAYQNDRQKVTASNYRYKRSVAQSPKELQAFIDSAEKIQRAKAPTPETQSTLLVTPFELNPNWYRNQLASVNLADLTMASLIDVSGVRLVDRQQIKQAISEMTLSLGMDANQSMRLGAILKADMILRHIVVQDKDSKQTTLKMQVIDTAHTNILVQEDLKLQAHYEGHFAPTQEDVSLINQTAPALVKQAIIQRRQLADKLLIAPLFIHNRSSSQRLTHYQTAFRKNIEKWTNQSNIHVLKIAGLEHTGQEQAMGITGLAEHDPNAWQYVADQYLWGYYAEGKYPDNTPVDDIPVTIKLYSWDGLNLPTQTEHQTRIAEFETAMHQTIDELKSKLNPTRSQTICKGLNAHIAHSLITELRGDAKYKRDQIDLALFFDPTDYKIALERAKFESYANYRTSPGLTRNSRRELDRWEDFFTRFPLAPVKEYAYETTSYLRKLNDHVKANFYLKSTRNTNDMGLNWTFAQFIFPLDMPLDVMKNSFTQTLERCNRLERFLPTILDQSEKYNRADLFKSLSSLEHTIDQLPLDNQDTRRTKQVIQQLIAREQQTYEQYVADVEKRHQERQQRQAQTLRKQTAASTTAVAQTLSDGPEVDPKILKSVHRKLNSQHPPNRRPGSGIITWQQAPAHPAETLDIPQVHWPVVHDQNLQVMTRQHDGHHASNSRAIKLVVENDHVGVLETDQNACFFNAAFESSMTSEQPHNQAKGLNDLIIFQNKAYLSQNGIIVIDLDTGKRISIGLKEGLANTSTTGMTRIGDQLIVCHSDHRISLIDLNTHKIIERKLNRQIQGMFQPNGKNMQALGQWIFLDDRFLYDFNTGKVEILGEILHRQLGDQLTKPGFTMPNGQYIQRSYTSIHAQQSTSHQNDLYLTTQNQLIHLNMQSQQAHTWKLPMDIQPDMLAADSQRLYLAYRQAKQVTHHQQPRNTSNESIVNWHSYILVWDMQQQAITQRFTMPGDLLAINAADGHLWAVVDLNTTRLLIDLLTDHPDAQKPLDIRWNRDQPLGGIADTRDKHQAIRLAYAGQLEPVIQWAGEYQRKNRNQTRFGQQILKAAMFHSTDKQFMKLAGAMYPETGYDLSELIIPLKQALTLRRPKVFQLLLRLCALDPPSEFSKKRYEELRNGYWLYRKQQQWEHKARHYGELKRMAQANHQFEIYNALAKYDPPGQYQSMRLWYHPHNMSPGNYKSQTLTPLTMSILMDDQALFNHLCKHHDGIPIKDENTLIAALSSHQPDYLQALLTSSMIDLTAINLSEYRTLNVPINPQRVSECVRWLNDQPGSEPVALMLKIAIALDDQSLIAQTISQINHPNDPQLLKLVFSVKDTRLLDMLLKQGWDVARHTPLSVLHRDTTDDLKTIDWLIEHGYPINQRNDEGQSLLMLCAQAGRTEACYLLMQANADLSMKDRNGQTALSLARRPQTRNLLKLYLDNQNKSSGLIATQPRPDDLNDSTLDRMIVDAVKVDEHDKAMLYLTWRDNNSSSNGSSGNRLTSDPLLYAASRGDLELVQRLLNAGCNISATGHDRWTPLMYASANGHVPVTEFLLDRGANWRSINAKSFTALELARHYNQADIVNVFEKRKLPQQDATNLIEALARDEFQRFEQMINDEGYDINAVDENGQTVLFYAYQTCRNHLLRRFYTPDSWRNEDLFDQLLALGADIQHTDQHGLTVLGSYLNHRSINVGYSKYDMEGPLQPIRFLIKRGILKNIDTTTRDKYVNLINRHNSNVSKELKDKAIALFNDDSE